MTNFILLIASANTLTKKKNSKKHLVIFYNSGCLKVILILVHKIEVIKVRFLIVDIKKASF